MTVTAQMVINEARSWLGIPYAAQGRTRAIGVDCGGLLLVVGRALGLTELEELGYANSPDGKRFEQLLEENSDRIEPKEAARPSDILAVDYGLGIQHTMFVTQLDPLTVIHAKRPHADPSRTNRRGVIEHRLLPSTSDLRGWVRTYRLRGVIYE